MPGAGKVPTGGFVTATNEFSYYVAFQWTK